MELHLKINDVLGMDDQKRHILHIDGESLRSALIEHDRWLAKEIIKDYLLKHNTRLLNEIIEDPVLRNNIYMSEKAKREAKSEQRERKHLFEIEYRRRQERHKASIETRKALDFYKDILGAE